VTRLLLLLSLVSAVFAQDAAAIWKTLLASDPDPKKTAAIKDVTIARDRLRLVLRQGAVQLALPAGDVVFGASFQGRGVIEVDPPFEAEKNHLRLLTGKETLAMEFTEAVFLFNDGAERELSASWASGATATPRLIAERLENAEEQGNGILPRLLRGVLSADRKRTAFFLALLRTRDKGWIQASHDSLDPEEISVGRWGSWERHVGYDSWLSFPAGGRTVAQASQDPLAREDFLVRGYQIDATVTDSAELRATTRVTLDFRASGERVLVFDLDANLRLESVKLDGGAALPFFQPRDPRDRPESGDYVAVVLPESAAAGKALTLEFRYGGKRVIRKVGAGNYFCQSFGWYPTRPYSFAARAAFEMNFRSPKKYLLVATGSKTNDTVDGDQRFTSWKSDIPLAVAGFAFGDYKVHTEKAGNIEVEIYANREADDTMAMMRQATDSPMPSSPGGTRPPAAPVGSLSPAALAKTMGVEAANTLRLFENFFGPYPYKRLAVTNIPYSYGQGWPMLIYLSAVSFLDSTQRNAFGIRDHTQLTDFFRAHETSHQWWGHRVSWKTYHDQWLSEGFAQFSGNLYVQYRRNERSMSPG